MITRTLTMSLIVALSGGCLFAQASLVGGLIEAQGSVLYSFSDQTQFPYGDETFDRYFRQHNISLQPSVGYFFSNDWELILQPHYSFQLVTYNYGEIRSTGSGYETIERKAQRWSYSIGIVIGFIFHVPLSRSVSSFIGATGGLNWRKVTEDFETGYFYSPPWSKPEVTFPGVSAGLKIFIVQNWAFIPQVQLSRTTYPDTRSYEKELALSFGVGFAVYFGHENGS